MSAIQRGASQPAAIQLCKLRFGKPPVTGGGGYWERVRHAVESRRKAEDELEYNNKLLEQKRLEAERREAKLSAQRKRDIQELALADSLLELNKEILLIEQQNILLMRLIQFYFQEEEEIYILIMCISS